MVVLTFTRVLFSRLYKRVVPYDTKLEAYKIQSQPQDLKWCQCSSEKWKNNPYFSLDLLPHEQFPNLIMV